MQVLKIINPENIDEKGIIGWQHREAARAVVFDNENRIGLLNVKRYPYYKLPGGGVEESETIEIALDRECKEELGVEIKVIKEIGSIIEYRAKWKLCQISYCFLAKINSEKGIPNFTDKEKAEIFEIVWAEPREALKLISSKQTSDYEGKFIGERDFCFLKKALQGMEL